MTDKAEIARRVVSKLSIFAIRNVRINKKKTKCDEKYEIVLHTPHFNFSMGKDHRAHHCYRDVIKKDFNLFSSGCFQTLINLNGH